MISARQANLINSTFRRIESFPKELFFLFMSKTRHTLPNVRVNILFLEVPEVQTDLETKTYLTQNRPHLGQELMNFFKKKILIAFARSEAELSRMFSELLSFYFFYLNFDQSRQ